VLRGLRSNVEKAPLAQKTILKIFLTRNYNLIGDLKKSVIFTAK
jgi:hypothetical protein